jgi:hypothetical protein
MRNHPGAWLCHRAKEVLVSSPILLREFQSVDRDSVSPDLFAAAAADLSTALLAKADERALGIDWSTALLSFTIDRHNDLHLMIQAEVLL